MDLVADIGNTKTKLRYFNNHGAIVSSVDISAGEEIKLKNSGFIVPDRAIICDVAARSAALSGLLRSKGVIPIMMSAELCTPLSIQYKTPATLGGDRIAAAVGANFLYPAKNILIIDAGTAITYDYVDKNAAYLGGNISPGLILRYKSLSNYTGKLPLMAPVETWQETGTSTAEAIVSGVQNGILYEIENYIRDWYNKTVDSMVILTGGDISYFVNSIKSPIFVNFELVPIGLKRILDLNAE
ncbi:MAG: type III pantothenate kinase [Bacteroidales bacterium]|nr:type III pantothenate kinase [Bacteroidales bacterium]HOY39037.1 type III pantothenate kinase [Bacteroidales bacterium]HQP04131.1 type III pantothenate kinase [Bacteroidales bacterium]